MSSEPEPDLELEIAHILLIDVVGYSKLLVNGQIELLERLNRIVRNTAHFRAAEAQRKLMRIPTGDGMALLFFDAPEAPVQCALEISAALKEEPLMQLRMGVHSGPIKEVRDVNDQPNFAGAGINTAQRVVDCGDAGHILLSERIAEDLRSYKQWHPFLHDLGDCEVKHGVKVHLFNLCKNGVGNPAVPSKVIAQRRSPAKHIGLISVSLVALALIAAVAIFGWRRGKQPPADPFADIPFKSIAVLPFENLSDDKSNVQFAAGVQDDILTALAKLADLKVISRTSVLLYTPEAKRNIREIALALRVRHVLEGSVQRSGNRIRIHAQLIDATSDAHIWAQRFDRELTDVFAIQSQVAVQISTQLEAKLSPQERAAIADQPTTDLEAYQLYARAKGLIDGADFSARRKEDLSEAARLLMEAVGRDREFAPAYYQLAFAHDQLYIRSDRTPGRLNLAEAAIRNLQQLRPNAPETHLALAKHLYWAYRDYEGARQELEIARPGVPNDPLFALISGFVDRRQGRWENSIRNLEHAIDLDPNNPRKPFLLFQIALSYENLRRFPEMAATLDRAIELAPNDLNLRAQRAVVDLEARADTKPLRTFIADVIAKTPDQAEKVAGWWYYLAMCEHDFATAAQSVRLLAPNGCATEDIPFPNAWCEGVVAHFAGDEQSARANFGKTKAEAEKLLGERPQDPGASCVLAMANAALGLKDEAIQQGQRAVELLPISKDAINGNLLVESLAVIYAWTGERDRALAQLKILTDGPSYESYGNLRLHPYWESLRGDPRFEQIVLSLAPK